jgi:hypothetical protein
LVASWRNRDPPGWAVALIGMALGLGLFVFALALLGALYLAQELARAIRG